MSPSSPTGPERPEHAVTPDEAQRLGAGITELVADLRHLAPGGPHGDRAHAALDRLLDLPVERRCTALAVAFEEFAQACAAAAPDPDAVFEDLRGFVREHHAALLLEPSFARWVESPHRRATMMAWLLHENAGSLEHARAELRLRESEVQRLRSEVARIEAERLTLEADLARSRALADRGLAAAGLAHDFNNVLQVIVGHTAEALGRLPAGEPEREAMERVAAAAERAAELSRGLARWDRDVTPRPRAVDVNDAVAGVLDLLGPSAPRRVTEQRVLPPGLPHAWVDPTDLRRIVLNLVMNAWQAIGTRRGTVRVGTGTLAGHGGTHVYVEVEDDGPGMDEAVQARVFEPFHTTRADGSGVGLPTVRLLAERWGGHVEAWSARGAGARFRVSLPAAEAGGPSARA